MEMIPRRRSPDRGFAENEDSQEPGGGTQNLWARDAQEAKITMEESVEQQQKTNIRRLAMEEWLQKVSNRGTTEFSLHDSMLRDKMLSWDWTMETDGKEMIRIQQKIKGRETQKSSPCDTKPKRYTPKLLPSMMCGSIPYGNVMEFISSWGI